MLPMDWCDVNVFLINPPYLKMFSRQQRSPAVIKSGTLYYPYWLSFAAGALKKAGFNVLLVDAVASDLNMTQCVAKAEGFSPCLAVVETSTPSIANDLEFCRVLKDKLPGLVVAIVGTHPSACYEEVLKACRSVDIVAIAEYEATILDIAKRLAAGKDWRDVLGIAYRSGEKTVKTSARPFIENLDELPFVSKVYKEFLPIKRYYFSLARHPMVMLITGRGCPNGCFFCVYPQTMHGHGYRFRSPENVLEELKFIKSEMPEVKEVVFEDDTFTADEDRVVKICQLMRQAGIRMNWFANVRVNTRQETLREMKLAGFRQCAVGFESGDQSILDAMGKGIKVEQSLAFKKHCDELGILVHGCFMVGFPGETKASMERTLAFAKRLNCDSAQFYPVFPYPGTKAHDWVSRQHYLKTTDHSKWLDSKGRHECVYDLPDASSEDMQTFCDSAYTRYHLSPRYILKKMTQSILSPREAGRNMTAGFNFIRSRFVAAAEHGRGRVS
ncbi:MAG: radical SAM protein [Candidatus Omnitrophota bacterium]